MIQFNRDASGLYLSDTRDNARIAFLFSDEGRTDPTFQLTAQTWGVREFPGFFAFFAPSKTRNWNDFATILRKAFAPNPAPQVGWFPDPPTLPNIILMRAAGTTPLANPFSLQFRKSAVFDAQPDPRRGSPVLFDDTTNSLTVTRPQSLQLTLARPAGSPLPIRSTAASVALPMAGPLGGTANVMFQLKESDLAQNEAGVMFFTPPRNGTPLGALRYPVFRPSAGAATPFAMSLTLDIVNPLDPLRSFFQFVDPTLGSYFVTAMGQPLALNTVNDDQIANTSRLVFRSRPVKSASDQDFYYLTPAGQFTLAADGGAQASSAGVRMLCGVTGTEFLQVGLDETLHALEFDPDNAAWRIDPPQDPTAAVFLDATATTAWARILTDGGSYVAQPERAPLYAPRKNGASAAAAPSGLSVYVLGFKPTDVWQAPKDPEDAPLVPLVPYAGLDFTGEPALLTTYLDMEAGALNPTRANKFVPAKPSPTPSPTPAPTPSPAPATPSAMTPQGTLVGLKGDPPVWDSLQIAVSASGILGFDAMGPSIQKAVQQNQIFTVISVDPQTTTDPIAKAPPLFGFDKRHLEIGDWTFDLSPAGQPAPDGTPPIFIMKFYPGKAIKELVGEPRLWSQPDTFNAKGSFSADKASTYLAELIATAEAAVAKDKNSLYVNFCQVVADKNFNGILAVNCNMALDVLPTAIKAVLGGMKNPGVDGFRVHHVGIAINDTNPQNPDLQLTQSSMFALVDYEAQADKGGAASGVSLDYGFGVQYLRALFLNSELRSFDCKINLTLNKLFEVGVTLGGGLGAAAAADGGNVVAITGSYQDHSGGAGQGGGVYSFVAQGTFNFNFAQNNYLKSITLTKLQFSFDQETQTGSDAQPSYTSTTSHIVAHFGIWGSIVFNNLQALDVFSFKQLTFSDLGINLGFDLTIYQKAKPTDPPPPQPSTANLALSFEPGDLRLDLGNSPPRQGDNSLLSLLPFKLKSFLYSQKADQTIESLNYYALDSIPGFDKGKLVDTFNYALIFDLDLGSVGGLVGSLAAFKFSFIVGWTNSGGLAFGVQLPQVNGKLEIKIEGVLTISIQEFVLEYATGSDPAILVVGMHDCSIEVLGKRLPPEGTVSLAIFAPSAGADQIGWIGAYNKGQDGGKNGGDAAPRALTDQNGGGNGNGGGSKAFDLDYLGIGQRVGPDPKKPPDDFDKFLKFMQDDFWTALKNKKYADIYHPDGKWIFLAHFTLLEKIELGFVFYDVTPFYALLLRLTAGGAKGFSIEIIYTKVTDTIGRFATTIGLPDSLRTFQVGAASVTLPNISIDIYTNGDWKVDLGFPNGDDWSVCFRVEAQAGPVPVTGSGGLYVQSLSSATDPDVFTRKDYASILGFGLAARLGVGKDFTAGPFKAGVSVTFFGIIQGAAGYLTGGIGDLAREPDALSLQGQFGIIGELYGSLDFVIIQASVNVRLEASIGIILLLEPSVSGRDGSILLYIEASVSVSVTVTIDLFLFSIHISFSFNASFRFEWQLAGSGSAHQARALFFADMRAVRLQGRAARALAAPAMGLCPDLPSALPFMFLPEITVVFADAASAGAPWLVTSLALEYDNSPPGNPTYNQFKPFEAVTTQLATFALIHALGLSGYNAEVPLDSDPQSGTIGLKDIDSAPEMLTGWIDYDAVLGQLANFAGTLAVPHYPVDVHVYVAGMPMLPFLTLSTKGRTDGSGNAAELDYQFASKNAVPASYLKTVNDYFNQLFVNRTSDSSHALMLAALDDTPTPLSQEILLDYFKGLIRAAVHQLLVTLQDLNAKDPTVTQAPLDMLFRQAVGAGRFQALAGQMSSVIRGGVRLPDTAGLTLPDSSAPAATNPLFALLWQEFPVGGFADKKAYTITLANVDATQTWLAANATYTLTNDDHGVAPFQNLHESDVAKPNPPAPIPLTQVGPQAFPFRNAIVWTKPSSDVLSLRPFPPSLARLQVAEGAAAIDVLIKSRPTGGAYLAKGTTLAAGQITFATRIDLTIKQIPAAEQGQFLANVFALSGASQADEALLGRILAVLKAGERPIQAINILYPPGPNQPGLASDDLAGALTEVFVLRTNTTSVSQPPQALRALAATVPTGVSVGADLSLTDDGGYGFLQIIQQATVTNAPGYYLRYRGDKDSLDPKLFANGPATLTLLVTYLPGQGTNQDGSPLAIEPYYNAIALDLTKAAPGLLYYAETTDPALATRQVSLAAGTFGVELTRPDSVMQLKAMPALAAGSGAAAPQPRAQAIKAMQAAGITDADRMRRMLLDAGSMPAGLNALYSLVTYQVQPSAGFVASNLSAPFQPQKPDADHPIGAYRIVAPLYNVAQANQALPPGTPPNRYAGMGDAFALSLMVNDAFGNQLPTALPYADKNFYFDPIVPLDQWQGIVPSYDFARRQKGVLDIHLKPDSAAFDKMSPDQRAAALAHYRTIADQIGGPGISFYVETNLALQADQSFVVLPLGAADAQKIAALVAGMVEYLQNSEVPLPAPVDLSIAVSGPGALSSAFEIAVSFGIERDANLISPYLKDASSAIIVPAAQNVAAAIVAATGGASLIAGFADDFAVAFPAQRLAIGLNGASAPQPQSKAMLARRQLRALGLPTDGTGGGRAGTQSIWAVAAALLDVSIGASPQAGPRFLSPKPLSNVLSGGIIPVPTLPKALQPPSWPTNKQLVDVDLDQYNRVFFQAVDDALAPASAAQAFASDRTTYEAIANGRANMADGYADNEVDWLFPAPAQAPYTEAQIKAARDAFGQQMRAALQSAYSVDTIVQYDVAWNSTVPADADGTIELFGQVEATVSGTYSCNGTTVTATASAPHYLAPKDRILIVFTPDQDGTAPADGLYQVDTVTETTFTITTAKPGSGTGSFTATRQNVGLSTAHVGVSSQGSSLLTFLYGNPDAADAAIVPFDLRLNVTNLQYFLGPAGSPDEARPSIWLQLVQPLVPHIGPTGTPTRIPVVLRQYPTPPTLVGQSGLAFTPTNPSGNPLADAADWKYGLTYQAALAAQDQINANITYNTNLRSSGGGNQLLRTAAIGDGPPFDLFTGLARFTAVYGVIRPILPNLSDPHWGDAVQVLADRVGEVTTNTNWHPRLGFAARSSGFANVTDSYVVTDLPKSPGSDARVITLQWPASQGQSTFAGVTLAVTALDPTNAAFPQPSSAYPGQTTTSLPDGDGLQVAVPDAPVAEGIGVAHLVEVDRLNVLSVENAIAAIQLERNLITLNGQQVVPEFVYKTTFAQPAQPVTPFIDNTTALDVTSLPDMGQGAACPVSPKSLCQRIYTIMRNLLADPVQAPSLKAAHAAAGVTSGTTRRLKVACSYRFPVAAVVGGSDTSIAPLVPIVLARSFDIDGHEADQVSDFAVMYADAITTWAKDNGVVLGPQATPKGAVLVFDITLYAALAGVNTPVLRLGNLELTLTDIDPA